MQLIKQNYSQNATQVSTDKRDSHQDKSNIYTLESLIQTLEEVASHLTRK